MLGPLKRERNQVVAHFKNGKLLKGYTLDFTSAKEIFHLTSEKEEDKGKIYEISTDELKAIFFVKTLGGNKNYIEKKRFDEVISSKVQGMKVKVEFSDGEIIRGKTFFYNKNKPGFFIFPVDPQSNNESIYVLKDAIRYVETNSAAEE